MKAILFLLLTLGVSSASACSHYQFCHCQDNKGTPNDTATNTVCNGEGVAGQMRTLGGDSSGSPYKECLKRVVGITAVGGQIAKVQGHQEPILFALVNVYSIKNVRRDYWKMILE